MFMCSLFRDEGCASAPRTHWVPNGLHRQERLSAAARPTTVPLLRLHRKWNAGSTPRSLLSKSGNPGVAMGGGYRRVDGVLNALPTCGAFVSHRPHSGHLGLSLADRLEVD